MQPDLQLVLFSLNLGGEVAFLYSVHLSSHCLGANRPSLSKFSVVGAARGMQNHRYFGRVKEVKTNVIPDSVTKHADFA